MNADFHKVGALVLRDGEILLCRKRTGTALLILPGGCIEPGESHFDCLSRELHEELGDVKVIDATYLATYQTPAATGGTLQLELYTVKLAGVPAASSEISEIVWFHTSDNWEYLAPSLRFTILPDLIARGILQCYSQRMPIVSSHVNGAPCWFELATKDQNGAKEFYKSLLGWESVDNPMGPEMVYTTFQLGGNAVGACYTLMPDMVEAGIPPHWAIYFQTDNADATEKKVKELGGSVKQTPMDVWEFGRFAVLADPGGAVFSVWQPKTHTGATVVGEMNTVCWVELATRDVDNASTFYRDLFGWSSKESESAGPTKYIEFTPAASQAPSGGMLQMDAQWEGIPSNWSMYVRVADCDITAAQVKQLGGNICHGPFDLPKVGRMAVCNDPSGAIFSIIQLKA